MSIVTEGVILIGLLFFLLGSGIWVALSLFLVGFVAMTFFTSAPVGLVLGNTMWESLATWTLVPLPLFVWMGEILFRTRLSEDMFSAIAPWIGRLPGRLLHVNVLACGIFAAVSGSSAATVATIGRMSIPELKRRGYSERMIIGTLAGSGTLGLLIPPSIIMIVYAVLAQVSIARLFIAGVIPGLVVVSLFMVYIALWSLTHPRSRPPDEPSLSLLDKIRQSGRLIPVVLLIVAVIDSIYAGVATPTEADSFGVAGALLLSWAGGSLTWESFRRSLTGGVRTTCMIGFILAGASFLTVSMGYTGIPRHLATWIDGMQLSTATLLVALTVFFMIMGCFLDGISIVVLTASVILPMVQTAGLNLMWFGVYLIIVVEMAQITPPVGFNLFVLQGMTDYDIFRLGYYALPCFLLLVLTVVLITVFPGLVTWLPATMTSH
jgi:tripartite ATP-independent transporter DctM subunit